MNQAKIDRQNFWGPAFIFIGWTLYGIFFASQAYLRQAYLGRNANWQNNLAPWLICAYTWALLTPLILTLASRFPFERKKWLHAFAVHLPAAAALSLFQLAAYTIIFQLIFANSSGSFIERYQALVLQEFHAGVVIYFAILAINFARAFFFKPRDLENHRSRVLRSGESLDGSEYPADEQTISLPHLNRERQEPSAKKTAYAARMSVKENGRIVFVDVNDIDWINSEGNYIKLHTKNKRYLIRDTMNATEQKLDPHAFVRIRRSTIVRVEQIGELHPTFNGEFDVLLKNGTKLSTSRRYRKNLDALLKS